MKRVLITGGTGGLGRQIVNRLLKMDYTVRLASRHQPQFPHWTNVEWIRTDLSKGLGLQEAVADVDTIIHAATNPTDRRGEVDVEGTKLLLEHTRAANVRHFIYVSIVGIDQVPYFYYRNKLAAEKLVREADAPWTIARATQFHSLLNLVLKQMTRLPVMVLPTDFQFQPVDPGEVADYFCTLVESEPAGCVPDFGGPEVQTVGNLAKTWLQIHGLRKPILHIPTFGKIATGVRQGKLTCPQEKRGTITWTEWVQRQVTKSDEKSKTSTIV